MFRKQAAVHRFTHFLSVVLLCALLVAHVTSGRELQTFADGDVYPMSFVRSRMVTSPVAQQVGTSAVHDYQAIEISSFVPNPPAYQTAVNRSLVGVATPHCLADIIQNVLNLIGAPVTPATVGFLAAWATGERGCLEGNNPWGRLQGGRVVRHATTDAGAAAMACQLAGCEGWRVSYPLVTATLRNPPATASEIVDTVAVELRRWCGPQHVCTPGEPSRDYIRELKARTR